ncbi:MAG: hypothetical protein PHQ59_01210 [Candidatus Daviesbacteria bacterium]|nr:hypothetical protein [Candidatus Daviesbacteria bacterium]
MKYDTQVSQIQPAITGAQNILIAIPTEVTIDRLASGLALYLSLKTAGKNVSIVTDGVLTVGFTHLFGIGNVKNTLPQNSSGDYTITLGNVVAPDGHIPALQNLDWAPAGNTKSDLKLTFHVNPGQKFEPTFVTPAHEGGNFDLIITIGANTWLSLGSIYANSSQMFTNTTILNIDNQSENTNYGQINLVDGEASLSEIIGLLLPALNLPYEADTASNIIAGLYDKTQGLQTAGADTYEVMAQALRVGGQKPSNSSNTAPMSEPAAQAASTTGMPAWVDAPAPIQSETSTISSSSQGLNISPFLNPQNFSVDTTAASTPQPEIQPQPQQSAEEVPMGEQAQTTSPEADWLTPKIFKSSKIG